jgi:DNA-binding response OmpR family regulator
MAINQQILIIDSDDNFLRSTQRLLKECGEVLTTSDPKAVPKMLANQPIRVLVLDIWSDIWNTANATTESGNRSGMLQFIRSTFPEIPVIIATAFASKEMAIEAANLHVFAILEKPLEEELLLVTVKRALYHSAPYSAPIDVALDSESLSASLGGARTYLTHTEFQLLSEFTVHRGKRLAREDLISSVWGEAKIAPNVFDTHLGNLKKKLPILKARLRVIRGKGYVFS